MGGGGEGGGDGGGGEGGGGAGWAKYAFIVPQVSVQNTREDPLVV